MAGLDVDRTRPIELLVYALAGVYLALFAYSLVDTDPTVLFLADLAFGVVIAVWGVDMLTVGGGQGLRIGGGALVVGGLLQVAVTVLELSGVVASLPVAFVLLGVVFYIRDQSAVASG